MSSVTEGRGIVWHYTTGTKFQLIAEDGVLRPATAGVQPPEKPILWFSAHPEFEPTACKMLGTPDGLFRILTVQETSELCGGLVRFGVPRSRLHGWPKIARKARMPSPIAASLEAAAREQGADPFDWYGTTMPIDIDCVPIIDVFESGRGWVRIRDARAAA